MKINELNIPYDLYDAQRILEDNGWWGIGQGAYGSVYEKEGFPYVLKVFKAKDTAYMAFVELAMNNPSIHFPKFYKKIVKVTPDYNAVRMEPLMKCTNDDYETLINLAYYMESLNVPMETMKFMNLPENESLKDACDLVDTIIVNNRQIDLKIENFMKRGSTIVFVDPVCNYD